MTSEPTEDRAAYTEAWRRELRSQVTYFDYSGTPTAKLIDRWDIWMQSWCEAKAIGVKEDYPVAYLVSARAAFSALAERRRAGDSVARRFFEPIDERTMP